MLRNSKHCLLKTNSEHGFTSIQTINNPIVIMVSFDNTELAFAHQNDSDLKRSKWLFQMMGNTMMLKFGLKTMPLAVRWKIPFTNQIIRNTIFKQFVGGESLQETKDVVDKLGKA